MKVLHRFFSLLVLISIISISLSPSTIKAIGIEVSPEIVMGPELVIWEAPPRDGPSIQVPVADRRRVSGIQSTGLDFNVTWSGSWPVDAQTAYNYALDIWSSQVADSGVTVEITATWKSLGASGPLGSGGPGAGLCISGCPYVNTFYPSALLDKILGVNVFPAKYDIRTTFNSDKDFYFGLDGNPISPSQDFVTIVLHEIGHGLGFAGGMWVDALTCDQPNNYPCFCGETGEGLGCLMDDYPFIYDQFTEDASGVSLMNTGVYPDSSVTLAAALQSDDLYFDGAQAYAANGDTRVPIYAPTSWHPGSSYSHLDYDTYYPSPNSLMTYMLTAGDSMHDPGPVTLGIFEDLGWGLVPEHMIFLPLVIRE